MPLVHSYWHGSNDLLRKTKMSSGTNNSIWNVNYKRGQIYSVKIKIITAIVYPLLTLFTGFLQQHYEGLLSGDIRWGIRRAALTNRAKVQELRQSKSWFLSYVKFQDRQWALLHEAAQGPCCWGSSTWHNLWFPTLCLKWLLQLSPWSSKCKTENRKFKDSSGPLRSTQEVAHITSCK